MPILIQEHSQLRLHRIVLQGRVMLSELFNMLALHKLHRDWAAADTVHVVEDDADLSDLSGAALDALRAEYRTLQADLDLFVVRRALWLCRSKRAWELAEYWVKDRHWRDGQGSELMLVANLDDAGELFAADELAAAARNDAWVDRARIDHGAQTAVA